MAGVYCGSRLLVPACLRRFGQQFHANEAAGVWALHVWNWRNNPDGMFADWNPNVSCEYAN